MSPPNPETYRRIPVQKHSVLVPTLILFQNSLLKALQLAIFEKKKKKVAKLVLTHLLRTDKQKFTKAVLNKKLRAIL